MIINHTSKIHSLITKLLFFNEYKTIFPRTSHVWINVCAKMFSHETINSERKSLANVNAAIDPHASLDSNGLATFLPLIILPPRGFSSFFTRVFREQRALKEKKKEKKEHEELVGRRGRRENFAADQRKTATDRLIDPRWSARLIFLGQTFATFLVQKNCKS